MKIAYLSPLPPARTGIAHYSAILLPGLRKTFDVTAFSAADSYDPESYDLAIYQLGNNPHHEWIYREAMRRPGIAVLHDLVLHHLIVEMTLARGDVEGFVEELRENHGEAGAAWARGRAVGLHGEIGNFLLPSSTELASRSRAVIVHNLWAAERLRSFGIVTPVHVVPHPFEGEISLARRDEVRASHGFAPEDRVIGFFGFLTSAKRAETILEAFRQAHGEDPRLKLLIVGEPAPNVDLSLFARNGIVTTGYVADEEFDACYAAADRVVNLRYPSAGETSGTLVRAFAAGKPVAVSDYAQFAEYPDSCAVKIPLGDGEAENLVSFFLGDLDGPAIAAAQRAWLAENATLERTVSGYASAIQDEANGWEARAPEIEGTLPLFARLKMIGLFAEDGTIHVTVRNIGDSTIRARTYGAPEYRVIAKLFAGAAEVQDRWLSLPGDIAPGAAATLSFPATVVPGRYSLRLYEALQDVPAVDETPWASAEIML